MRTASTATLSVIRSLSLCVFMFLFDPASDVRCAGGLLGQRLPSLSSLFFSASASPFFFFLSGQATVPFSVFLACFFFFSSHYILDLLPWVVSLLAPPLIVPALQQPFFSMDGFPRPLKLSCLVLFLFPGTIWVEHRTRFFLICFLFPSPVFFFFDETRKKKLSSPHLSSPSTP